MKVVKHCRGIRRESIDPNIHSPWVPGTFRVADHTFPRGDNNIGYLRIVPRNEKNAHREDLGKTTLVEDLFNHSVVKSKAHRILINKSLDKDAMEVHLFHPSKITEALKLSTHFGNSLDSTSTVSICWSLRAFAASIFAKGCCTKPYNAVIGSTARPPLADGEEGCPRSDLPHADLRGAPYKTVPDENHADTTSPGKHFSGNETGPR